MCAGTGTRSVSRLRSSWMANGKDRKLAQRTTTSLWETWSWNRFSIRTAERSMERSPGRAGEGGRLGRSDRRTAAAPRATRKRERRDGDQQGDQDAQSITVGAPVPSGLDCSRDVEESSALHPTRAMTVPETDLECRECAMVTTLGLPRQRGASRRGHRRARQHRAQAHGYVDVSDTLGRYEG